MFFVKFVDLEIKECSLALLLQVGLFVSSRTLGQKSSYSTNREVSVMTSAIRRFVVNYNFATSILRLFVH